MWGVSFLWGIFRLAVCLPNKFGVLSAAGTRMPWHPVPSRAASAVLAGRCFDLQSAYWCCNLRLAYQTALGLYPLLFYKESAFCFGCFFCLSQCGIPHRTCRFYCCLAAHQRTRKKDSAEPSFPILWTPPHPPGEIRFGGEMYAAAGL